MSKRTREAERQFGDALRNQTAFCVKATPDYKAIAKARKAERMWLRVGYAMSVVMASLILMEVV